MTYEDVGVEWMGFEGNYAGSNHPSESENCSVIMSMVSHVFRSSNGVCSLVLSTAVG